MTTDWSITQILLDEKMRGDWLGECDLSILFGAMGPHLLVVGNGRAWLRMDERGFMAGFPGRLSLYNAHWTIYCASDRLNQGWGMRGAWCVMRGA